MQPKHVSTNEFQRGDQIIYVPNHADSFDHDNCEKGFVTSTNELMVFCRFFANGRPNELRTIANSEGVDPRNLHLFRTHGQGFVGRLLKSLDGDPLREMEDTYE